VLWLKGKQSVETGQTQMTSVADFVFCGGSSQEGYGDEKERC
jgi:hypothetical protein